MRFLVRLGTLVLLSLGRLSTAAALPQSPSDAGIDFADEIGENPLDIDVYGSGYGGITGDVIVAAEPQPESHTEAQKPDMGAGNGAGLDQTYDIRDRCTEFSGCQAGFRCNICQSAMFGWWTYRCVDGIHGTCRVDTEGVYNCDCFDPTPR